MRSREKLTIVTNPNRYSVRGTRFQELQTKKIFSQEVLYSKSYKTDSIPYVI